MYSAESLSPSSMSPLFGNSLNRCRPTQNSVPISSKSPVPICLPCIMYMCAYACWGDHSMPINAHLVLSLVSPTICALHGIAPSHTQFLPDNHSSSRFLRFFHMKTATAFTKEWSNLVQMVWKNLLFVLEDII